MQVALAPKAGQRAALSTVHGPQISRLSIFLARSSPAHAGHTRATGPSSTRSGQWKSKEEAEEEEEEGLRVRGEQARRGCAESCRPGDLQQLQPCSMQHAAQARVIHPQDGTCPKEDNLLKAVTRAEPIIPCNYSQVAQLFFYNRQPSNVKPPRPPFRWRSRSLFRAVNLTVRIIAKP